VQPGVQVGVREGNFREEIGKDWVVLTKNTDKSKHQVGEMMNCQVKYFDESEKGSLSIFQRCVKRGIIEGFNKWWGIIRTQNLYIKNKEKEVLDSELNRKIRLVKRAIKEKRPVVYIDGKRVEIPALYIDHPPALLFDPQGSLLIAAPVDSSSAAVWRDPFLQQKEQLYAVQMKRFLESHPRFKEQVVVGGQAEKCMNNRVYILHEMMKEDLERCKKVEVFEQKTVGLLGKGSASLEELEYLNRVLFNLMTKCGLVNYYELVKRDHAAKTSPKSPKQSRRGSLQTPSDSEIERSPISEMNGSTEPKRAPEQAPNANNTTNQEKRAPKLGHKPKRLGGDTPVKATQGPLLL
jgi:hypothetical protein